MKFKDIIKNPNIIIHCPTLEQAKILLTAASNARLTWANGQSYKFASQIALDHSRKDIYFNLCMGYAATSKSLIIDDKEIVEFDKVQFNDEEPKPYINYNAFENILKEMTPIELSGIIDIANKELLKKIKDK